MTLGRLIFTDKNIIVPYAKIASLAAGLALPLMVRRNTFVHAHFLNKISKLIFAFILDWDCDPSIFPQSCFSFIKDAKALVGHISSHNHWFWNICQSLHGPAYELEGKNNQPFF